MKSPRSFMLPLLAALALSPLTGDSAHAKKNLANHSSFAYLNALLGSNKTDVYMDGKAIYRNAREGRPMKPKWLQSEGYSLQVNAAKIGLNYLDLNLTLIAGRDYTLIPMNDLATGGASALLIDLPHLVVPKFSSHIVFAVAVPDAQPVDVLIDGQLVVSGVAAKTFVGPGAFAAGKHTAEIRVGGVTVWSTKKLKLKKGKTTTLILTGTMAPDDKYPIRLEDIVQK